MSFDANPFGDPEAANPFAVSSPSGYFVPQIINVFNTVVIGLPSVKIRLGSGQSRHVKEEGGGGGLWCMQSTGIGR